MGLSSLTRWAWKRQSPLRPEHEASMDYNESFNEPYNECYSRRPENRHWSQEDVDTSVPPSVAILTIFRRSNPHVVLVPSLHAVIPPAAVPQWQPPHMLLPSTLSSMRHALCHEHRPQLVVVIRRQMYSEEEDDIERRSTPSFVSEQGWEPGLAGGGGTVGGLGHAAEAA